MRPMTMIAMAAFLILGSISHAGETTVLTPEQLQGWKKTLAANDYLGVAKAYADYMIEHGRDVYGKRHTPLFVTGMNRYTGKKISPPFAHVKRKPFMPGWERDRELRGSDRNYGQADPLDQLVLLQVMHRLTEITGEKRYAEEADKTASWWLANTQTGIGLYPWGTHTFWNVEKEGGGGRFEFNHPWPYWKLNPEALQKWRIARRRFSFLFKALPPARGRDFCGAAIPASCRACDCSRSSRERRSTVRPAP